MLTKERSEPTEAAEDSKDVDSACVVISMDMLSREATLISETVDDGRISDDDSTESRFYLTLITGVFFTLKI